MKTSIRLLFVLVVMLIAACAPTANLPDAAAIAIYQKLALLKEDTPYYLPGGRTCPVELESNTILADGLIVNKGSSSVSYVYPSSDSTGHTFIEASSILGINTEIKNHEEAINCFISGLNINLTPLNAELPVGNEPSNTTSSMPSLSVTFKGPNTEIHLPSIDTSYFRNKNTGEVYATFGEAEAAAKQSAEANAVQEMKNNQVINEIPIPEFKNVKVKGLDGNLVDVGPSEQYFQAQPTGSSEVFSFALNNLQGARDSLCSKAEGGTIYVAQRGITITNQESVPAWSPDPNLVAAFGGQMSDFCQIYWVYSPQGQPPMYAADAETGIQLAKNYRSNLCEFPGGDVVAYKRGVPQPEVQKVPSWTCAQGLGPEWTAESAYYERNSNTFPSKGEAINSDLAGWLLGLKSEQINVYRRGELINDAALTNWWAPWQWIIPIGILLIMLLAVINKYWPTITDEIQKGKPKTKSMDPLTAKAQEEANKSVVRAGVKLVRGTVRFTMLGAAIIALFIVGGLISAATDHGDFIYVALLALIVVIMFLFDKLVDRFENEIKRNEISSQRRKQ